MLFSSPGEVMHAPIQIFLARGGGGGGSRHDCQKTTLATFIFSPQSILQFYSGSSMVYFKENYDFQGFRGGPIFFMGIQHFLGGGGGGSKC